MTINNFNFWKACRSKRKAEHEEKDGILIHQFTQSLSKLVEKAVSGFQKVSEGFLGYSFDYQEFRPIMVNARDANEELSVFQFIHSFFLSFSKYLNLLVYLIIEQEIHFFRFKIYIFKGTFNFFTLRPHLDGCNTKRFNAF